MKLTFISPSNDLMAFGIRAIASYLNMKGFETQLFFLPDPTYENIRSLKERLNYTYPEKMLDQLKDLCRDSDLVGISLFSCYFPQAVQLSRMFQSLGIPVMWGGKHPSALPEKSLKYADMVCVGEGEYAVLELVDKMQRGKDYSTTQNFFFSTPNGIKRNAIRPLMMDLDQLPLPNYTFSPHYVWLKDKEVIAHLSTEILKDILAKDPLESNGRLYWTMASRGCSYNCTYCYTFKQLYKGQKYQRRRSIENLIRELEIIKEMYGYITHVIISDDDFISYSTDEIREFAQKYRERVGLHLSCNINPVNITKEKLELLVDAGLSMIQMGIQSVSTNGKRIYKRAIPNAKIMAAAEAVNSHKSKVFPMYDFIIDNPYETKNDILETLRFLLKLPKPRDLNLYSLIFLPGTEIYSKALSDGLLKESEINYVKVFKSHDIRYLNLIFFLAKCNVPRLVLNVLISKPAVLIFERKWFSYCLAHIIPLLKKIKIQRLLRKSWNKHFRPISDRANGFQIPKESSNVKPTVTRRGF
ncbi:MAG: B12-binding domain-containing radical SAM protein [Promethearchaeota archaeon]|jgi:radical SAM superfamily enzyme YgiQ (UPF0313 family)